MESTAVPAGTIVVGVDGSPSAETALRWAVGQARLERRDLTLLHAVSLDPAFMAPPEANGNLVDILRQDARALLESSRALVDELVGETAVRPTVRCLQRLQDPRTALVELSREAALVVLGSRGRGPVRSMLLGSVGAAVTDRADCPVVVIRPHAAGLVRRGILVGVDGTDRSAPAIEFAYRQASLQQLPLTVLHCYVVPASVVSGSWAGVEEHQGLEQRRLLLAESVAGMTEKYPDVHATLELAHGLPDQNLVERSALMDLVVVGTRPLSWFEGIFVDDVSRRVVERARTVVVVVPG